MQWIDCFETQHMYEATMQDNDVDDECVASLTIDNWQLTLFNGVEV